MAEPKATTLQQKFGFGDSDLKTSNHDEIMIWLDGQAVDLTKRIFHWKPEWPEDKIKSLRAHALALVEKELASESQRKPVSQYLSEHETYLEKLRKFSLGEPPLSGDFECAREWEVAINPTGKFIIGFLDMKVTAFFSTLIMGELTSPHNSYKSACLPKWDLDTGAREVFFEVKSAINSLGDVMRQINMYREFVRGRFFIVCPDDKFAPQLHDQGIGFVKYPSGEIYGEDHG